MVPNHVKDFDARQRVAPPKRNSPVVRERDSRVFAGQILLLVCGAALACGFVYAAGQKFAAMRYGYASETLRQEQERLLTERRRLTLEFDKLSSPLRLEKAAKNTGLDSVAVAQIHAPKADAAHIVKASGTQSHDIAKASLVAAKTSVITKSTVAAKTSDVVKANKASAVVTARR